MDSVLFKPLNVGRVSLAHRVVMAPLSRFRFSAEHTPLAIVVEYYTQRASVPGTLIIAEAVLISEAHGGFPNGPGIWSEDHVAGWKVITDAVHSKGCSIFCQLVAPGRAAYVSHLQANGGHPLLSSSAIPLPDSSDIPQEMTAAQIESAIEDFVHAARNAIAAGFDGIELHGANGYLIDQFIQDNCNKRTDQWGGSMENRAKFPIDIVAATVDAIGADRVAFRVSPFANFQGMRMEDPVPQFSYLVSKLKDFKLAYLHIIESRVNNWEDVEKVEGIEFLLDIWNGISPVFVAGGFTPEIARKAVDQEYAKYGDVAVVFGRHFLANPDLPFRIKNCLPLNKYDRSTFYTASKSKGYIDYPFHPEFTHGKALN
ncbi:NADH:flavin oxidoreductase/NADH oxidase [Penicillium taxi]|uniref:NADH:flavin oxidoreductase/NADH oxidase n=1 Tax=Penicillium taxi TaxID=168475 RepID=UPI002544D7E4|nr:NADH:flavin oxidoreductase/NADH oxidase [Penicillium taxi]KAJ5901920.1 NADH:flavin oxidoreductase/NADH oxidase [Penicillium taxi]